MTLEQIKIMTCGNVDDGKSTLLGRYFWEHKIFMKTN